MRRRWMVLSLTAIVIGLTAATGCAQATEAPSNVLTIGRRDDSTTLDPIKSVQNVDIWVVSNIFDGLLRVDRTGTKLEPGLAESWMVSDDGLTYRFAIRAARFSDGSPITAADAAFSLLRIRDDEASVWRDSFSIIAGAEAADDNHTLIVMLKTPSAPFLAMLALPGAAVVSEAGLKSMGPDAYAEKPVASGAFTVETWRRGDRVILKKNPEFWQADRVRLDGVEWVSVPDDNTRILAVRSGELDTALSIPFSRVAELQRDPDLTVHLDPSTLENHLLINNDHGVLADVRVRQALDIAIDKQALVEAVTFGLGEVADSYIPKGALFYVSNPLRPHDPEMAKAMLAAAGATGLTLSYVVNSGNEVDEQIAVLLQQQLAAVGTRLDLRKIDSAQTWDELAAGNYDLAMANWTNDILDPDQKTTFALGDDGNRNFLTRYRNDAVTDLVAAARTELDPATRGAMYQELQKTVQEDVPWINLFQNPYINISRNTVDNFYQNPLGRLFLEDTTKNQ
jgi:peptide/nickel transport system substrate-binding protein